jgi:hypothetical protein
MCSFFCVIPHFDTRNITFNYRGSLLSKIKIAFQVNDDDKKRCVNVHAETLYDKGFQNIHYFDVSSIVNPKKILMVYT